jgi:leucyl aminopeptidase
MQTTLSQQAIAELDSDALIVLAFDKEDPEGGLSLPSTHAANQATSGWIAELYQTGELKGKLLDLAILPRPAGLRARRLIAAGAGKSAKFGSGDVRKIAGAAVRALKPKGCRTIALILDARLATPANVAAAVEGAMLGDYEPDRYKTENKEQQTVERFVVAVPVMDAALERAIERGRLLAESQNFTRDLANEPPNRKSPSVLAERAQAMANEAGLECTILNEDRMRQLGMGALLGVAQGSAEPPVMIVLRYHPPATPATNGVHLGLVGKGVTFDTGGISIKPADGMEKMKYDMAGGAAVIGAMRAIARLKPSIPVTALVPAVENMPGSRAQRPGDVVTTLSGKTVEVLNTDAEGRLILADALEYAHRIGCTHLVDVATLTGAIVIALGNVNSGAFANDDPLLQRVLGAANAEDEKMWHMPLDEDYREILKSPIADLPNIGNRWGGAIYAATFLKEFADPTPWAHLDIAGTAWLDDAKPFLAKGPTGVAVRTLVNLAENWV